MHELSIAENISQIVMDSLKESGAQQVTYIEVEIGALSGIETEALQFALGITLKGSPAEEAKLHFIHIEGIGRCETCGKESQMEEFFSGCQHCQSIQMDIISGKELKINKIEVFI